MRRLLPLVLFALLAVGASASSAATVTVSISKTGFTPKAVTVRPGDAVTWTNTDTAAHRVVSDHNAFPASPVLQPGQSYSFTFTKAGKYAYRDADNPRLKGTVTVSPNATTVTLSSPKLVVYGNALVLSGTLSSGQTGQRVSVLAEECNTTKFVPVGDATTTTGGAWTLAVKPHRLTVYQAHAKGATSSPAGVQVKPRVGLTKLLSPRRFVVRVSAAQSYVGKYVLFQRYRPALSRWVTVKRVVLRRAVPATAPTVVSSATFRSAIRRGLRVRAFITKSQTGSCYAAGWSSAIRS
jgi:plastocyanin